MHTLKIARFAISPNWRTLRPPMTEPYLDRALTRLYGKPIRVAELVKLRGDASTRSYYRARTEGGGAEHPDRLIVMQLPPDAFRSDEGGEQPELHRLPFLEVAELLESRGLPVPAIYADDLEHGIVLVEDLGDTTFEQRLRETPKHRWNDLYGQAVDLLVELHERCADLPEASVVCQRRFDRDLLDWELDHFRQWGLEAPFGELSQAQRALLDDAFASIASGIETMPYGFVHRDYQSKNLMVDASGKLTLIDFQDALLGPRAYDLVALLCDSYVAIEEDLQEAMIDRYAALRHIDADALRSELWLVALHRKLKDAGRFVFIDRVRGNPDFLPWYPQSLVYVGRAIGHLRDFAPLGEVLETLIPGYPDRIRPPASVAE